MTLLRSQVPPIFFVGLFVFAMHPQVLAFVLRFVPNGSNTTNYGSWRHRVLIQNIPAEGLFLVSFSESPSRLPVLFHWPELHHVPIFKPITGRDHGITMADLDQSWLSQ